MKAVVITTALVALCISASAGYGDDSQELYRLTSYVCATCHGPDGNGTSSAFPRLAGQHAAYLEAQLKAFRNQIRADPSAQAYMWAMSSMLTLDTIKQLAAYYASQVPVGGKPGDAALMTAGELIYEQGIAEQGVPACRTCHGSNAQGKEIYPRLAGQYPEYLLKQLLFFQSLARANAPLMHAVTDTMTFAQMQAVATFAASK
jgi:cytochrome c553